MHGEEGGPTGELGPARPRPEGNPPIRTDEKSLTVGRFLGWGRNAIGIQDPIPAEITWWGLMLIWPKIFTSLTNKKTQGFWVCPADFNSYVGKKTFYC